MLPLGLGLVGGVLREEGHEVRMLLPDSRPYKGNDPWGEIARAIELERPDLVGITGMTPNIPTMVRLIHEARRVVGPDIPIVVGGQHATTWAESTAMIEGVTAVVSGEGEEPLKLLCAGFAESGPRFDPSTVAGVTALINGEIQKAPPPCADTDLDRFPWSLREGFVWDELLHPLLFESIITLRGCPYKCSYCAIPMSDFRKTRYRSSDHVIGEIEYLLENHNIGHLQYYDPVFNLNKRRTHALLNGLEERGIRIPFMCQTRADRVDNETLDLMTRQGCRQIYLGIESGHEDTLRRIRKPMSLDTIRGAARKIQDRGIEVAGYFMVGFPWETETEINQTIEFALELDLDRVSLHSTTPLPRTELWSWVPEEKRQWIEDFMRPKLNLTSLPDSDYAAIFEQGRIRFERHNRSKTEARFPSHWPGSQPDAATPPAPSNLPPPTKPKN